MSVRNISVDLLKIGLAISVILLHCAFLKEYNEELSYILVQGIFRVSVPVFFIINGYYFKKVLDSGGVLKWVKRVVILYSVWSIIYIPFWVFTLKLIIVYIIIGYFHLWYIKAMLLCGITLFLLRKLDERKLLFLSLNLFVIGVFLQYAGSYHIFKTGLIDDIVSIGPLHRNFLFLGLPFFIIGYLINICALESKLSLSQNRLLIVLGIVCIVIESLINFNNRVLACDNLFSLILVAPLIFLYSLKLKYQLKVNSKNIALVSTAMYLIHPWIIHLLNSMFDLSQTLLSIFTVLVTFCMSLLVIKLNKLVKILL